ncbi:MAG: hypothetical protein AB1730_24315 [Myxococcota bacterium]
MRIPYVVPGAVVAVVAVAVLAACGGGSTGGGCKVQLSGPVTADMLCIAASAPQGNGSGLAVTAFTTTKPRKTLSLACASTSQPPATGDYSGNTCFGMWREDVDGADPKVWQGGATGAGSVKMTLTGLGAPLSTVDGGYTLIGSAQATLEASSGGATGTVTVNATF